MTFSASPAGGKTDDPNDGKTTEGWIGLIAIAAGGGAIYRYRRRRRHG